MRASAVLLACLGLVGCATKPPMKVASEPVAQLVAYEEAPSSALVFDPPVIAGAPPVQLSREERQPSAFVGFDGPTTTFFWIHTDDRQNSGWGGNCLWGGSGDRFERRAVIDKVGTSSR